SYIVTSARAGAQSGIVGCTRDQRDREGRVVLPESQRVGSGASNPFVVLPLRRISSCTSSRPVLSHGGSSRSLVPSGVVRSPQRITCAHQVSPPPNAGVR